MGELLVVGGVFAPIREQREVFELRAADPARAIW